MAETETTTVPETSTPVASTEKTVLQVPSTMKALVEALIFAAQEPLSVKQIQALYDEQGLNGESRKIESSEITRIVEELNREFESSDKAYRIVQIAGGYQFATLTQYAEWLGKLYKEQARRKLSQSSIESLAIIAYKQPISKPEIEAIRGVNCDYVLKTLLEKELVTIVGRAPTPGRPLLYGTTKEFLKHFGLNEVTDLPRPREIEEILGESQFEAERRMLEAQQGLTEEKKKEEDFKSRLPHIPKRKAGLDENVQILPRKKQREIKIRTPEPEQQAQESLQLETPPVPVDTKPVENIEVPGDENSLMQDASQEAASMQVTDMEPPSELSAPSEETAKALEQLTVEEKRDEAVELGVEREEEQRSVEVAPLIVAPISDDVVEEKIETEALQVESPNDVSGDQVMEIQERDSTESVTDIAGSISSEPEVTQEEQEPEITVIAAGEAKPVDEALVGKDEISDSGEVGTIEEVAAEPDVPAEIPAEPVSEVGEYQTTTTPAFEETSQSVPMFSHPRIEGEQAAHHSKSKWQTWKEKIQGFIKKLFA